jgi:hypothetical protein
MAQPVTPRGGRRYAALAVMGLGAITVPSSAQSVPDLSGTWVLNAAKSQMGGKSLRSDTTVITRVGTTYHIVSIVDAGTGPVADTLIVPAGDGESTNLVRGVQVHGIVTHQGDTSVTSSDLKVDNQTVAVTTSRAWMSTDKQTLTKVSDLHPTNGAPIHLVLVYDRK